MSTAAASGDALARERIQTSLDESLIVEASAGTGKTTELTNRIVHLLKAGKAQVGSIVAVTFTNKAAGELKIRVRQGLDEARSKAADPVERQNLEDALAHLEEAFIGTIHAFCAQILRQRPVEARVDPAFEELTEPEAARIFDEAFNRWFQAALNREQPGLHRALARLAWPDHWETGSPIERLRFTGRKLTEWRDFPTAWRRELFPRRQRIDELLRQIEEVAVFLKTAKRSNDSLVESLKPLKEFRVRTFEYLNQEQPDYDTLEALLTRLSREITRDSRKGSGPFAEGVTRDMALKIRHELIEELTQFAKRADADLAAILREELQGLVTEYDRLKQRVGKLDFLDLLIQARNLVRDDSSVRAYLQKRYTHLFIDEFQDTDPLQAETILLLAADDPQEDNWLEVTPVPGKLFLVGDPKQSIYKFRRADVLLYQMILDSLGKRGVRMVRLTKSYRAVRPIQELVNNAFRPVMTGDPHSAQAGYSDLEEHWPAHDGQPSVVALPVHSPYGSRRIAKGKIDLCLPDTVGAYIEWLIRESGWQVRDPEDPHRKVPIAARHIAILFRRFTNNGKDLTRDYVRSLEARAIPHLLVGSRSFHDREEIETMRAALTAVEWPDDELSVYSTLRGSLFAIEDEFLFRYRLEVGRLQPFAKLKSEDPLPGEFLSIRQGLELLRDLHKKRNSRPIADTVSELLEATRAHAGFALRPAGHQVLANVNRIGDLARNFEMTGGISYRGFVDELARQAEKTDSSEAPVFEHASNGVRLMTVHTAKGLEFPIVILGDITANISPREADRHIDPAKRLVATRLLRMAPWELREHEAEELEREKAEGVRVAYVAATRAKDLLVIPAVGDEPHEGWLAPLNSVLYPPMGERRKYEQAPGCPHFKGEATVLERPIDMLNEVEFSVRPGLHGNVVWWDPLALALKPPDPLGLRQEDILTNEQPAARESANSYADWQFARAAALDKGGTPSLQLVLASDAEVPPEPVAKPQIATVAANPDRPYGPRFGTLVHTILRHAHEPSQVEYWAAFAGAQLQATGDEIAAAMDAAKAALAHPLLERSRIAQETYHELPITMRIPDSNRVLEGVVDLAFVESGRWTIVDFKTTQDLAAQEAKYARQLQWYAYAISKIRNGVEVDSWILGI